jgi:geranylgeranyl reductase family protein
MRVGDARWDVVVAGGGPAGSVTAALLAQRGHRVALVDRARFPREKPCAEYVSPGGLAILQRLGVLERLEAQSLRRLRGMWVHAPSGASWLVQYSHGVERAWAAAVRRTDLDAVLLDVARASGVTVHEAHTALGLPRQGAAVTGLVVRDPHGTVTELNARLVVGADGVHSTVVRELGVRRPVAWPRRLGLVAHFRGVGWHEDVGQMHVGSSAYVGLAPLGDGSVSVGLVRRLPKGHLGPPAQALDQALRQFPSVAARLQQGKLEGSVLGVGPIGHVVTQVAGPGWLLVGDAAGFFDPFTGEGIYRALRGAELAAEAADQALRSDGAVADIGLGYAAQRSAVFRDKTRLTRLIQVFVRTPPLLAYALARLAGRPTIGQRFANVLGDLEPAGGVFNPATLARLLAP